MNLELLRASSARLAILFAIVGANVVAAMCAHAADWLQFGFDPAHSNNNDQETTIAANMGSLQLLFQAPLPASADGAPVYLSGVTTAAGQQNLLFLTTTDGHIVALDGQTGEQVWSQLPASGPAKKTSSSPVIDPNRLFVYSYGLDGKVHKFAVGDGTETVDGTWPEVVTLKPEIEKGSSALTFATAANGRTYLFAATSNMAYDSGDYQGHVVSIDLFTGANRVFNSLCSNQPVHFEHTDGTVDCPLTQSGIWTRPAATYDVANDRIYVATGNGPYTGNTGGFEWGESVIALAPSLHDSAGAALTLPLDSYTPSQFESMNDADLDLGVSVPAILPVPADSVVKNIGVQIGKDAIVRLLNLDDLSGGGGPGHLDGEIGTVTGLDYFGFTSNQSAVWVDPQSGVAWFLLACKSTEYGFMVSSDTQGHVSLVKMWTRGTGGNGGGSPVVADGVEFVIEQNNLMGLDPKTGTQLWTTPVTSVHWASPIVVDGTIYFADGNSTVVAYGLPKAFDQFIQPSPNPLKPSRSSYRAPVVPTHRSAPALIP